MELKQIKCQCCGSNMELIPGLRRLKCSFCGANYIIEYKNDKNGSSRSYFDNNDNPADILLIRLESGRIYLNVNSMPGKADMPTFSSWTADPGHFSTVYPEKYIHDYDYEEEIRNRLYLIAAIAHLTGETYDVEVGHVFMDPVLLYHNGLKKHEDGHNGAEDAAAGYLTNPKVTYRHWSGGIDAMRKDEEHRICYNRRESEKLNREWRERVDALAEKYCLEYEDSTEYSDPHWEYYKKYFLGRELSRCRLWFTRYTDRRLFATVGPDFAQKMMPAEDFSRLERIGENECIKDISAAAYRYLSARAKNQLESRTFATGRLSVNYDKATFAVGKDSEYNDRNRILFSSFGMSQVRDAVLRAFLLAHIYSRICRLCRANNDVMWNVTDLPESNAVIRISPDVMTKGVYNEWV